MPISLRTGTLARQQGLTIKAGAERAGVASTTAHALGTGRATCIDLDTLDRICTALAVEPRISWCGTRRRTSVDRRIHGAAAMSEIGIGQRVRVIAGELTEYTQLGRVVAAGTSRHWNAPLDGEPQAAAPTLFHAEELQAVDPGSPRLDQARRGPAEAPS